jgi:hypothetical protein
VTDAVNCAIVVCDTNVFVRETHLLRKKGGPQLVRLLRAVKGQLFVPEILKTEYIEQTRLAASEERNRAAIAIANFGTLVGSTGGHPLLGDDAVDQRTLDRLGELEILLLSAPMTEEVLAAAGQRSLQKKRPTSKTDHGYKDCLIWESVLRLPAGSQVYFISRDSKAFFEGDKFAPDLIEEGRARGITIAGYRELDRVLRELQAGTSALDLATIEALDLVESQPDIKAESEVGVSIASITTVPTPPPLPPPAVASEVSEDVASVANQKLSNLLAEAHKPFKHLDRKVLGYISYLGSAGKAELFDLLSQSGLSSDVAKNVAERLVIAGLIRDTGNHYLPLDPAAAELAATATEPEIIELLNRAP